MKKFTTKKGFTLIELLIVVAIIAILAAIAIPNFLAAQTRSKVARVKGSMRTAATALESYYVDNNAYPDRFSGIASGTFGLPLCTTTPISYISKVPDDIFDVFNGLGPGFLPIKYRRVGPQSDAMAINVGDGTLATDIFISDPGQNPTAIQYVLFSMGPGRGLAFSQFGTGFWTITGEPVGSTNGHFPQPYRYWYDPTNGVVSLGYVTRSAGGVSP